MPFNALSQPRNQSSILSFNSTMASTSTLTPNGSALTPTALLAPLPLSSPKTSIIKSLTPFTTSGCSSYPSTQLTKPKTLTTCFTLLKSPPQCSLIVAILR